MMCLVFASPEPLPASPPCSCPQILTCVDPTKKVPCPFAYSWVWAMRYQQEMIERWEGIGAPISPGTCLQGHHGLVASSKWRSSSFHPDLCLWILVTVNCLHLFSPKGSSSQALSNPKTQSMHKPLLFPFSLPIPVKWILLLNSLPITFTWMCHFCSCLDSDWWTQY